MVTVIALLPILAVLAIGVISPGPSFILVARTAVAVSRAAAMASALGMACGAGALCVAALLGLSALLNQIPVAYLGLKILGGLYLLYLAYQTWRGARRPISVAASSAQPANQSLVRHFGMGMATMLSNPKAAVQYGVIFAAMLPQSPSSALMAALPPSVFVLEASWYTVVALALSAHRPRNAYIQAKTTIDRATGLVLGLLGAKLIISAQ
ncbi:MAG: LysE family translocator [Rhodoferax sp.]